MIFYTVFSSLLRLYTKFFISQESGPRAFL